MTPSPHLKGRVALITGASRGIGAAVAKRYAQEGAQLILVARTLRDLEVLDDEIREWGGLPPLLVPFDLKDLPRIPDLAKSIYERFGGLDILLGNAAILGNLYPTQDIPPSLFHEITTVNFLANWHLIRACDGLLKRSPAGRAIFTTATPGQDPYWSAYATSKAALETLVLTYAAEVTLTSLKVNLVDPGRARTQLYKDALPGVDQSTLPAPEDLTEIFVVAASEACPYHGEVLRSENLESERCALPLPLWEKSQQRCG